MACIRASVRRLNCDPVLDDEHHHPLENSRNRLERRFCTGRRKIPYSLGSLDSCVT